MLVERFDEDVNPQSGDNVGTARGQRLQPRPDPKTLLVRDSFGTREIDWIGWDWLLALMVDHNYVALRDGDRVIIAAPHWSISPWGRA